MSKTKTYSMGDVEKLMEEFSESHAALVFFFEEVQKKLGEVKQQNIERFRELLKDARERKQALLEGVESSPELFKSPRTRTLHGVKAGYRKGKGKLVWKDDKKVIEKIRLFFDDESGVLISVEETPNKDALEKLSAEDLKKLGITIEGAGDKPVLKVLDAEIDKLVEAVLGD